MTDDRPFTPKEATLEQALEFESSIGVDHVCIISTSVYGQDNACLVDALRRLNGKGRGVGYIDPAKTSDAELDELHAAGVRGVRLNLWTRGQTMEPDKWQGVLQSYADRLRRLDWVLQIFVSMDQIPNIVHIIPTLGVKVAFDHLGCPNPGQTPASQPGCAELYKLLENKNVYIKMSGAYRFEDVPGLEEHMKKLLEIAPDQIVWASDWPHTAGVKLNPEGNPKKEQEFLTPDMPGFLTLCAELCRTYGAIHKVWVDNPRKLWDYTDSD